MSLSRIPTRTSSTLVTPARVLGDLHGTHDGTHGYSARDLEGNLWSFGSDRPGG